EGATLDPADRSRLRIALRGAGDRGFLFINHHVRHHPLPDAAAVRGRIESSQGPIDLPSAPVDIPSGAYVIWPIGLGRGSARLRPARVRPWTRWDEGGCQPLVCVCHRAIAAELAFEPATVSRIDAPAAWQTGGLIGPPASGGEVPEPMVFGIVDAAG